PNGGSRPLRPAAGGAADPGPGAGRLPSGQRGAWRAARTVRDGLIPTGNPDDPPGPAVEGARGRGRGGRRGRGAGGGELLAGGGASPERLRHPDRGRDGGGPAADPVDAAPRRPD